MDNRRFLAIVIAGLLLAGGYVLHQMVNPSSLSSKHESPAVTLPQEQAMRDAIAKWKREQFYKKLKALKEEAGYEPTYLANDRFKENLQEENAYSQTDAPDSVSQVEAVGSEVQVVIIDSSASERDAEQTAEPYSVQEQAKALLGIDAQEVFGVDMDAERENIRSKMSNKTDHQLKDMLLSQGIDTEMAQNYLKIRQALKEITRRQPLGVRGHKIFLEERALSPNPEPSSQDINAEENAKNDNFQQIPG